MSTYTRTYTIYRNGVPIANDTWTSGTPVTRNVDNLPAGRYNYTIIADDGFGGSTLDTVVVMVVPNVAPRIGSAIGHNGTTISWAITDAGTGTTLYAIYRNGELVVNGTWTSGHVANVSTIGLATGAYNFTIVVTDGLGGIAQGSVLVVVVASEPTNGEHPRDGIPGIAWIVVIGVAALIALAIIMLAIRLRASGSGRIMARNTTSTGAVRRRLTSDDWIRETAPLHPATTSPDVTVDAAEQGMPLYCSRCGNAMPPEFKRGRYCGYCGEPFARNQAPSMMDQKN